MKYINNDSQGAYHNDQDPHKHCNKISEESQGMLNIVQITKVGPLNDFLCIKDDVPHKNQEAKVQLHHQSTRDPSEHVHTICANQNIIPNYQYWPELLWAIATSRTLLSSHPIGKDPMILR